MATALGWCVGLIALFSFLSVAAWSSARRKEREAYYKSEAIKKITEMQGATPEPVLQILRETMAAWKDVPNMAYMGPIQAKAYYRAETIKRIAEMQGAGADTIMTMMREEEKIGIRRAVVGLKLGGFMACAAGIALMGSLWMIVPEKPVYVVGSIPILVGLVLLRFGYLPAPKKWPPE